MFVTVKSSLSASIVVTSARMPGVGVLLKGGHGVHPNFPVVAPPPGHAEVNTTCSAGANPRNVSGPFPLATCTFSIWTNLQCEPVRGVNTREEYHWRHMHARASSKQAGVGTNVIFECRFLSKRAHHTLSM
jgi:hypothetical protein